MFSNTLSNLLSVDANLGDLGLSMLGLTVITAGVANWWREDLPFIGNHEQIATSDPFQGQHIRKAGIWVFIMSEVMVFATFFSSYLRMRNRVVHGVAGSSRELRRGQRPDRFGLPPTQRRRAQRRRRPR